MLSIRKFMLPTELYPSKSPYKMKPIGITIHNTWNTAPAINEASYMRRNPLDVSYHYAVDEKEAIQCLPEDRNGWHAGDSLNGTGNRKTIAIEIARSRSDLTTFLKAEKNGAILTALLLKKYGWTLKNVYKHQDWSGKYCPHRTLDLGYQRFLNMVQVELDRLNIPKAQVKAQSDYNGFKKSGNATIYIRPSGTQAYEWQKINGYWYYFRKGTGTMVTGWQKINSRWRFFDDKGRYYGDGEIKHLTTPLPFN